MDQAPAPSLVRELMGVPYIFNLLAIVLGVLPLLLITIVPLTEGVKRYFKIRSFATSALLNFLLVWHILFAEKVNEHMDALYVAMMGMTLSTICAYMWLLHEAVFKRPILSRLGMAVVVCALLYASGRILHALQHKLHEDEHKGWGLLIGVLAVLAALFLNGYTVLATGLRMKKVEPDLPADAYGLLMTSLNTADALYFVVYASYTGSLGSLLSWVSCITVFFGVFQICIYLWSLFEEGLVKLSTGIWCVLIGICGIAGPIIWV